MSSLSGKVVYLTGATHGIGRAIALRLAGDGVSLALCGRDPSALRDVEERASAAGAAKLFAASFDLREEERVLEFYRRSREELGPPHVLISNAGYNARKANLWDVATEEFDSLISVNLRAPFILIREACRDMKSRGSGHVVVVLSTVCHAAFETMGAYSAAKRGLEGLVDVLRKEGRPHGIRVTSMYPGGTDSNFRPTPRPDYMRPESVAEAVYSSLTLPDDLVMHEVTFRPMAESNF